VIPSQVSIDYDISAQTALSTIKSLDFDPASVIAALHLGDWWDGNVELVEGVAEELQEGGRREPGEESCERVVGDNVPELASVLSQA
jgi:hypothetical protein